MRNRDDIYEFLARLYDVADDGEAMTLDDLQVRAGVAVRLECGCIVEERPVNGECPSCGSVDGD